MVLASLSWFVLNSVSLSSIFCSRVLVSVREPSVKSGFGVGVVPSPKSPPEPPPLGVGVGLVVPPLPSVKSFRLFI